MEGVRSLGGHVTLYGLASFAVVTGGTTSDENERSLWPMTSDVFGFSGRYVDGTSTVFMGWNVHSCLTV